MSRVAEGDDRSELALDKVVRLCHINTRNRQNHKNPPTLKCLLGTKEVVTSKDCWIIYINSLIADSVIPFGGMQAALPGLVGQMASSDTPWALCQNCTNSLIRAKFKFRPNLNEIAASGHALCQTSKLMEFVVLDELGIVSAMNAAKAAFQDILAQKKHK